MKTASLLESAEVVEYACSVPDKLLGNTLGQVATDMDTYMYRVPLGVCAGIAPFNFPAMIPLWVCGADTCTLNTNSSSSTHAGDAGVSRWRVR